LRRKGSEELYTKKKEETPLQSALFSKEGLIRQLLTKGRGKVEPIALRGERNYYALGKRDQDFREKKKLAFLKKKEFTLVDFEGNPTLFISEKRRESA